MCLCNDSLKPCIAAFDTILLYLLQHAIRDWNERLFAHLLVNRVIYGLERLDVSGTVATLCGSEAYQTCMIVSCSENIIDVHYTDTL